MRALTLVLAAFVSTASAVGGASSPAAAAAPSAPSAESAARSAVQAYLALWSPDPPAGQAALFREDVTLGYAHSLPELQAEVRGRTSVITQIRAVARLGRKWEFRDLRVFPTLSTNVFFAQYTAAGTSVIDGTAIEQNVVLSVELDQRQIVRVVEYANPAIVLASRGHASLSPRLQSSRSFPLPERH